MVYYTYNTCVHVGRCGYATYNECVTVERCSYNTFNTCLGINYRPQGNFELTSDFLCSDNCQDCDNCEDCYGTYQNLINKCSYLNKQVTIVGTGIILPLDTIKQNTPPPITTCTTAGIKYRITNIQTGSVEEFDIPYNDLGVYDLSYTPNLCGVYKIEQIAYNCCGSCSKVKYLYVKDYLPEIDFSLVGLCDSNCGDDDCTDCNCASLHTTLTIATQIPIPSGFEDICPCPKTVVENYTSFQEIQFYCGVTIIGTNPLTGQPTYTISNINPYCQAGLNDEFTNVPFVLSDYVAFDGVIYERNLNDGSPIEYYKWTKPSDSLVDYTSITQDEYLDGTFIQLEGWERVDKPLPTITYFCEPEQGRRIFYKIYQKYPEKTLIYQSDSTHDIDLVFDWTPDTAGIYIIELHYAGCCDTTKIISKEVAVDIFLRPVKTACNKYTLSSCYAPISYKYTLYAYDKDYDGNWKPIKTNVVASDNNNTNIIIVPEDNIYKVVISDLVVDEIAQEGTEEFVIYEFCQTSECVAKINRKILCLNKCCEDNCLSDEQRQFRDYLNRFIALFSTYMLIINKDSLESKYAVSIEDTRLGNFAKLDDIRREILKICKMVDNDCNC